MKRSFLVVAVLVVGVLVVFAAESATPQTEAASTTKPAGEQTATLLAPPAVVAAIPYKSETDYEMDPFQRDLIRRTKTTVTHILIVRSDGSTQVRPAQ
ncbi:MAG: hypothetical protein N2512_00855 [Armatimonadetes bacterium]|nr:hypothetical protein [Armatimonadota bacterium]